MNGENFLTKNISSFIQALESLIFSEDIARAPGFLQRLDARVKLVTFLSFIVMVSLARSLFMLGVMCFSILAVAFLSRIPLGFFLKRVLFFIPVFTAVIAIPALFVTPGDSLVTLGSKTIITEQGARAAGFLILRVTDSLSLAMLLILSTPWTSLMAAMRWLRLPPIFVAILSMTYRYIFLLLHTANSMFLARRSRTVGKLSGKENRRWLGRSLTTTMVKSHHLSEEVYLAMLSRGYQGDVIVLDRFSPSRRDLLWGVFVIAAAFIFFRINGI